MAMVATESGATSKIFPARDRELRIPAFTRHAFTRQRKSPHSASSLEEYLFSRCAR